MIWKPWTLFTVAVAGWMSRQQQEVIAYLREENARTAASKLKKLEYELAVGEPRITVPGPGDRIRS